MDNSCNARSSTVEAENMVTRSEISKPDHCAVSRTFSSYCMCKTQPMMHERGSDYKADFHKYILIKRWVKTFQLFELFWDSHDDNLVLFLKFVCKNSNICFHCNNVWISLFQMRCWVKNWFTIDNPTPASPLFCPFSRWTSKFGQKLT